MEGCETNVWPKGLKKTKQRLKILETLREAQRPINAHEIFSILERRGSPMWYSTIYRVLDTFSEHGIIQKADVDENGTALYELNGGHRHYAVCVGCRRVIALESCPLEGFMPGFKDKGFHILGHKLRISGYCGDCCKKNGID